MQKFLILQISQLQASTKKYKFQISPFKWDFSSLSPSKCQPEKGGFQLVNVSHLKHVFTV